MREDWEPDGPSGCLHRLPRRCSWLGSRDDQAVRLVAATEALYVVFSIYRLKPHTDGYSHCVSDRDRARIYSRPLRELAADDLWLYASKAMTTWGDANDFRHFLPRLLELALTDLSDWVDIEVVLGKPAYANWQNWPERERAAVCGVGQAGVDVSPFIEAWRRSAFGLPHCRVRQRSATTPGQPVVVWAPGLESSRQCSGGHSGGNEAATRKTGALRHLWRLPRRCLLDLRTNR